MISPHFFWGNTQLISALSLQKAAPTNRLQNVLMRTKSSHQHLYKQSEDLSYIKVMFLRGIYFPYALEFFPFLQLGIPITLGQHHLGCQLLSPYPRVPCSTLAGERKTREREKEQLLYLKCTEDCYDSSSMTLLHQEVCVEQDTPVMMTHLLQNRTQ